MIPTRQEIQEKLQEIRKQVGGDQVVVQMRSWLEGLNLPETIIIAGENKDPIEQILADLGSYPA